MLISQFLGNGSKKKDRSLDKVLQTYRQPEALKKDPIIKEKGLDPWKVKLQKAVKESEDKKIAESPSFIQFKEKISSDTQKLQFLDDNEPVFLQDKNSGIAFSPLLLVGCFVSEETVEALHYMNISWISNYLIMKNGLLAGCHYNPKYDKGDFYYDKLYSVVDTYNKCPQNRWETNWEVSDAKVPVKMVGLGEVLHIGDHIYQMLVPESHAEAHYFAFGENSSIEPLGKFTTTTGLIQETNKNPRPIVFE